MPLGHTPTHAGLLVNFPSIVASLMVALIAEPASPVALHATTHTSTFALIEHTACWTISVLQNALFTLCARIPSKTVALTAAFVESSTIQARCVSADFTTVSLPGTTSHGGTSAPRTLVFEHSIRTLEVALFTLLSSPRGHTLALTGLGVMHSSIEALVVHTLVTEGSFPPRFAGTRASFGI